MEHPTQTTLRIGDWRVNPATGELARDGETARLEARALRLLLCLAARPGEVVSLDDLLDQVWSGVTSVPTPCIRPWHLFAVNSATTPNNRLISQPCRASAIGW